MSGEQTRHELHSSLDGGEAAAEEALRLTHRLANAWLAPVQSPARKRIAQHIELPPMAPYNFFDNASLSELPAQEEVLREWEPKLRAAAAVFEKTVRTHAKRASEGGVLETIVNGVLEARVAYSAGDYVLVGASGERYAQSATHFLARYNPESRSPSENRALEAEGFHRYQATSQIWAHRLTELEFADHFPMGAIMAAWGEQLMVSPGDYLAMPYPHCGELYRIHPEPFARTYARVHLSPV